MHTPISHCVSYNGPSPHGGRQLFKDKLLPVSKARPVTVPEQTCHGLSQRKLISKEMCLGAPCKTPAAAVCEVGATLAVPAAGALGSAAGGGAGGDTPGQTASAGGWTQHSAGCRGRSSSPSPNPQPGEKETNASPFATSSAAAGCTGKRLLGKPFRSPVQRAVETRSSHTPSPSFITKWVTQSLSAQYLLLCKAPMSGTK